MRIETTPFGVHPDKGFFAYSLKKLPSRKSPTAMLSNYQPASGAEWSFKFTVAVGDRPLRLSWFLPPERPHALRELSLAYAHRGKIKTAWRLAAKCCQKAEAMKARYEHAKSLLVQGQLAKQLGRPEADSPVQQATAMIQQIEY